MIKEAKVLKVDLSNKRIETEILSSEIYRKYPGGSALAMYLILKNIKPNIDPLGNDNVLVFAVSPLTGLPISGTSRVVVAAKSPLTNAIGDSQAGGFFPASLKANGYDAIVFLGKSEEPVYLYLDDDKIELRDASLMWGHETKTSEDMIKQDINDDKLDIAQIGPAGENLVKYACIINMCQRANGRTGMGAVMGSKNLKAIAVKRKVRKDIYDKENLKNLAKEAKERLKVNEAVNGLGINGTDGDLEGFNEAGFLPTRNWQTGYFGNDAKKITGETMTDTILVNRDTCYGCAVRCKRVVEIEGKVNPTYGGPEYETCASFGSYCGVSDLSDVALANQLCNMYGIDTISCGATISFAMECYEKGIISKDMLDGIELNFGDGKAMIALIEKIAKRDGIGNILAEGSRRAAEIFGNGADKYSMSVKGQELPAHMPQYKPSVGLVYAVNSFGADHQSSEHDPFLMLSKGRERNWLSKIGVQKVYDTPYELDVDKVRFAYDSQCFFSMLDTLCLCQFVWGPCWELYGPDDIIDLCKYGIGLDTSLFELMRVGERRINMMRYFNSREGFTKEDDKLPERIFEPFTDGPSEGISLNKEQFEIAKDIYYKIAGWNESGNTTDSTLYKLGLEWLLDI